MSVADSNGVKIAYEVRGDGEPVVLVHGLGYDRRGWGPLPDLLAERFRVVLFDNRGVGESAAPPGPYSVPMMVDDTLAVLDTAGIERTNLFGVSLGGYIAQELTVTHPERVERLILASTAPASGEGALPMPERGMNGFMTFPSLPRKEGLRMLVENSLGDHGVRERPELVEEIYRYRLERAPALEPWQAQMMAGASFTKTANPIEEIAVPTLVLHGEADVIVDPGNGALLAERIPNARLETVPNRGHLLVWEDAERVAQLVTEFLS